MPQEHLEVSIETHYWPAKCGHPKPTPVMTLDALLEICDRENSIFGPGDGPRFAAALATYAAENPGSEPRDVTRWREDAEAEIHNDDDDCEDAGPLCPPAGREDLGDASPTI